MKRFIYEPLITSFLKQGYIEKVSLEDSVAELVTLSNGGGE